jgi:hypothetical protein
MPSCAFQPMSAFLPVCLDVSDYTFSGSRKIARVSYCVLTAKAASHGSRPSDHPSAPPRENEGH